MSTVYETIKNEYEVWKKKVTEDADLTAELTDMEGKEDRITDAFYQNLAFGTGGLRGVIAQEPTAEYLYRRKGLSGTGRLYQPPFPKRGAENCNQL